MNAFYFTADWCNPCKKVRPIVEEINRESFDLKFQIIDADLNIELVKKFEIKSIPTFIVVDDGEVLRRLTGSQTKNTLEKFLNDE
jgi:thioredoxin 1